jgi:hypothetical protein
VTDGADIAVRLRPLKFSLGHFLPLLVQIAWVQTLGEAARRRPHSS